MKKIFILILLIFLMGSCRYHKPYHQDFPKRHHPRLKHYNKQGKFKGYWQKTSHGKILYFDKNGRYKGYSIRINYGKTEYYDERGQLLGNSH